jgi:hypothetical protein
MCTSGLGLLKQATSPHQDPKRIDFNSGHPASHAFATLGHHHMRPWYMVSWSAIEFVYAESLQHYKFRLGQDSERHCWEFQESSAIFRDRARR